jgi:glutamine amidotransferase
MITIIDYDMGNLGSILNMFKRLGVTNVRITSDLNKINESSKIILPGVGSFKKAVKNLSRKGLIEILEKKVFQEEIPLMGICLGMQLLFEKSEEGNCDGLGWIKGDVIKFDFKDNLSEFKVPHMGWNQTLIKKKSELVKNLPLNNKFYFAHSFFVKCKDYEDILMTTQYGAKFTSGIQKNNIFGFQFHPEKSHKYGIKIFENFLKI